MGVSINFRRALVVACLLPLASVLSACQPQQGVVITSTKTDPGKPLRHDWGPSVVIESGVANSCYFVDESVVAGKSSICRVVDGYEEVGDKRNWKVTAPNSLILSRPMMDYYSYSILLDGGAVFEGCVLNSNSGGTSTFTCDYRIRKISAAGGTGSAVNYFFKKLWNWNKYVGNTAGCALGISSVWSGTAKITHSMVTGCLGGPM